jgi:serine acetyltransferase
MTNPSYDPTMPFYAHMIIGFHRLHHAAFSSDNVFARKVLCPILSIFNQVFIHVFFHTVLPKDAEIGSNFMMPHPFGILISPGARIGSNVKVMHHVTLGHNELSGKEVARIVIGDNVYLGPGAKIIGNSIVIGDGAIIGANALIVKNVPPGAVMIGATARNFGAVSETAAS